MDYSKVKFVKSPTDTDIITKGKIYQFMQVDGALGKIMNDKGRNVYIYIPRCSHLYKRAWIPCDENGKELDNE